jgi:hypothetical protein
LTPAGTGHAANCELNYTPVPTAKLKRLTARANRLILAPDERSLQVELFRSRAALEAEILVLRHQSQRAAAQIPEAIGVGNIDRLVFTALYHVAPGVLDALKILKPQTVIRWHRAGFQAYWRWKSRPRGGPEAPPADWQALLPAES